jgi:hypothetical protein
MTAATTIDAISCKESKIKILFEVSTGGTSPPPATPAPPALSLLMVSAITTGTCCMYNNPQHKV